MNLALLKGKRVVAENKATNLAHVLNNLRESYQSPNGPFVPGDSFEIVKLFQKWLCSPEFDALNPRVKGGGSFHPSGVSDECLRAMALEFMRAPYSIVDRDPRLQITFDLGNSFHELLQKRFVTFAAHNGWEFEEEVRLTRDSNPWFISGRIDGVFNVGVSGQSEGLEIKTINERDFKLLWKSPLDKHISQGNVYQGLKPELRYMHYVYVNKATSAMKEFILPFDKSLFKRNMLRVERVMLTLQDGEIPSCAECNSRCRFYGLNCAKPNAGPEDFANNETAAEIRNFRPVFAKV